MADKKISQLTGATTPVAGTEVLPIVQGGSTKSVSITNLTAGRAVSAAQLDVDNVRVDANSITTTNTNGNLEINPDGSGAITLHGTGSSWQAGYQALEWGASAGLALLSSGDDTHVLTNAYFNGGYKYRTAGLRAVDYVQTAGLHIWRTAVVGTNAGDPLTWRECGRFTVGGILDLSNDLGGNIKLASGAGIDFSADAHATGMTSELLDDYEEGTWTPTLNATGISGVTYSAQDGRYTKVGNKVTLFFNVALSGLASGGSNYVRIEGIPYATAATNYCSASIYTENLTGGTSGRYIVLHTSGGQTSIVFWEIGPDGNVGNGLQGTRLTATSKFAGCITYQTA